MIYVRYLLIRDGEKVGGKKKKKGEKDIPKNRISTKQTLSVRHFSLAQKIQRNSEMPNDKSERRRREKEKEIRDIVSRQISKHLKRAKNTPKHPHVPEGAGIIPDDDRKQYLNLTTSRPFEL